MADFDNISASAIANWIRYLSSSAVNFGLFESYTLTNIISLLSHPATFVSSISIPYAQHWRQSSELTFKVIQGHRLLLQLKGHSLYVILLVISCHLSSTSHRCQDIASPTQKLPHSSLSPRSRGPPSNFAVKITTLNIKTLCYYYLKTAWS